MNALEAFEKSLYNDFDRAQADHIRSVILPSITADFIKILMDAPLGQHVAEDYGIDDGSGLIRMEGRNGRIESVSWTG